MDHEYILRLADQIEQELRDTIATEPYPYYTDMSSFCFFCWSEKTRDDTLIVYDERSEKCTFESKACLDCIQEKRLKVSDSEDAIDYLARTIAISRIRDEEIDVNKILKAAI